MGDSSKINIQSGVFDDYKEEKCPAKRSAARMTIEAQTRMGALLDHRRSSTGSHHE
jgi:hypothetical protein